MFASGNVYEGSSSVAADNKSAITFKAGMTSAGQNQLGNAATCLIDKPCDVPPVKTHSAEEAYKLVTEFAGAVVPRRDPVDTRVIDEVKNRTGRLINSPTDVGGWPELKSTTAPTDSDHDGIPDAWEKSHGLNPEDAADGAKESSPGGYTNLEIYLNELAASAFPPAN